MLVKADTAGEPVAKAGLLSLLGAGDSAMSEGESVALLRSLGERGKLVSPAQAAKILGVRRETLHKWEVAGIVPRLERVRIDGKRVGIRIEDVERAKRIVRKEVADDTQGS
jgi:hypothetical protein